VISEATIAHLSRTLATIREAAQESRDRADSLTVAGLAPRAAAVHERMAGHAEGIAADYEQLLAIAALDIEPGRVVLLAELLRQDRQFWETFLAACDRRRDRTGQWDSGMPRFGRLTESTAPLLADDPASARLAADEQAEATESLKGDE
jgi:hypothetical protein